MNIWIIALLVGSVTAAPSFEVHHRQTRSFATLLEEIFEGIGIKQILPYFHEMIHADPNQRFVEYMSSGKFDAIIAKLKSCPGFEEVKEKLPEEGVDLVKIFEDFRNFFSRKAFRYYKVQARRSLKDILDEFIFYPEHNFEVQALIGKLRNDPDMKRLVEFIKEDNFQKLVECLKNSNEVKELVEKLYEEGIEVEAIIEMFEMWFGGLGYYSVEQRTVGDTLESLVEDLELRDLLPWIKEKITDPDFQRIIEFVKSDKYTSIIHHLKGCPGYQEVKDKLKAEGVDLVKILESIRNFITGGSYRAQPYKVQRDKRNLGSIIDPDFEIVERMLNIIKTKYHGNPDLKKVVDFLNGDVYKGIVACMKQSPIVQELEELLNDAGIIDVAEIIEFFKSLLENANNYYRNTRNVGDFLESLIEDMGLRERLIWLKELIQDDPDAQIVIDYLKSDKFTKIENHLTSCPGYQKVKDKLKAEGVDFVDMLENIRNFFVGFSYRAQPFKVQRNKRNLGSLLDKIFDSPDGGWRMMEILQEKYHGNPNLKKVINFLKGDIFKGIVECMRNNPEYHELIQMLEGEGIDVYGISELFKSILENIEYYRDSRKVIDLIHDLIDELGLKELLRWIKGKIETDHDAQRVVDYLRGPVFNRIEEHLKACPGYTDSRDKLKDEGVDLVQIIEGIRNFFTGGSYYNGKSKRSLGDLISELLAKFDINHALEVIQNKIRNDPDMKKVIDFLRGDQFKGIVSCMKESKDVQDLIDKLADEGIDVVGLFETIKGLLSGGF